MDDEMMENAYFAQDTDEYNMYPNPSGFSTNYPVNDWKTDNFFGEEEPYKPLIEDEPIDEECGCSLCTGGY